MFASLTVSFVSPALPSSSPFPAFSNQYASHTDILPSFLSSVPQQSSSIKENRFAALFLPRPRFPSASTFELLPSPVSQHARIQTPCSDTGPWSSSVSIAFFQAAEAAKGRVAGIILFQPIFLHDFFLPASLPEAGRPSQASPSISSRLDASLSSSVQGRHNLQRQGCRDRLPDRKRTGKCDLCSRSWSFLPSLL